MLAARTTTLRPRGIPAFAALALLAAPPASRAQEDTGGLAPPESQSPVPGPTTAQPATGTGLLERPNLLGDMGGLRSALARVGVSLGLSETSEVFGNPAGGSRTGAAYDGLTIISLGLDTEAALGWKGGTFNVSAFQIHGRNLSADTLYSLQTASGIEAQRATRVWELWYMQHLANGLIDVKIGQQSLDTEFMTSAGSSLFINTAMGWPILPSVDLYGGGPAYPLASLGVRVRAQPTENLTVLGGVFDDNPPDGPFFDDSQVRGAAQSGTAFHLGTGALVIGEVQYALNPPPAGDTSGPSKPPSGLPGLYKIGFWYDSARFPSYSRDPSGLPLASPYSNGRYAFLPSNFSIYAVMDQMIWRPRADAARAVGVFARIMGAPGDRNLVDLGVNAGMTLKAPFAGRDNNTVGVGYGFARLSPTAVASDRDTNFYAGRYPVRGSESFVELTYQAVLTPFLTVQPDLQYVWTPGGGVPNPLDPARRVGNETILGLRSTVIF